MFKTAIVTALMLVGIQSQAAPRVEALTVKALVNASVQNITPMAMLNWNVGSTADYKLSGGIIQGTMHSQVREETSLGYWIQQDMELGFMGSQKVEIHINKETAEIIQILVNGQEQQKPDPNDSEIKDSRREKVTVPAGEFDSVYLIIHDKKKNEDSEVWVNPGVVPMGGMLKTLAPSPMGKITVELTAFKI